MPILNCHTDKLVLGIQYINVHLFILQTLVIQDVLTSINSAAISMNSLSTFSASFADVSK